MFTSSAWRRGLLFAMAAMLGALSGSGRAAATDQESWADLATPVFRTYGQDDGLPHPIVTAITEDGDGFIWVGTQEGLARWDGYHFRTYKPATGDAHALPDSLITTLHTDPRGRLWIGTNAGGLAAYDRGQDRFDCFKDGAGGLSDSNVRAIEDDGAGGLWIGTNGGLDHFDPASGRIASLHHRNADAASLPDDHIFALLRDRAGILWVGTAGGLARLAPSGGRFAPVALGGAQPGAVGVSSLFQDLGGKVWIGTFHEGAFAMAAEGGAGAASRPAGMAGDTATLHGQRIVAIAQASGDEIWLGTYSRGIVAVSTRDGRTHTIGHEPLVRQSLPSDSVWALHLDRAGAMWAGTDGGLSRLTSPASGAAQTVFGGTGSPHGLTEPNVIALSIMSDGHAWAGLPSKGLDILDPAARRVVNVAPDASRPSSALPPSIVSAVLEWPAGTVYVGTIHGLYRTDLTGGSLTRLEMPGRDKLAGIRGLFSAGGKLWIAGNDDGIWAITPDGGHASAVEQYDSGQMTDRRGTVFAKGAANDLWIGTRNGLNRLDLQTRRIERILPDRSRPASLQSGFVGGLVLDRTGRLWVGTLGGGIGVLVGRDHNGPVFRHIGTAEGLPDDNVDSLLSDGAGRIWAATDNGVAVIDPQDFSIHALHRAEGVNISSYWGGSAAATASGALLFGGDGGMTVIRPERFQPWTYRPRIFVTDAQVGGKPVAAGRFNATAQAEPLLVQPGANSLSVEFAALDYSAPERNRYAYKLEGFDRDWIPTAPDRRLATYMNLPPGRFTLHLCGSNREGVWSQTTLDIPLRVLPAWFQTLWFKIALTCGSMVAVWLLIRSRTIYLRRRQRELEQLVSRRTRELEESKRQIEEIAYHDALTGLPNRRLFTEKLRDLVTLVTREGGEFALLMIDLDRFKQINDTLGHDAGDALLIEAARRMRASLRVSDRLARLGGDEFAILITELAAEEMTARDVIERVCARIVDALAAPIAFKSAEMKTSASIGVALCPGCGRTPEALYKAADLALYEAKRAGRNTWRWHAGGTVPA